MKKILLLICAFAGLTMHASEATTAAEAAQADAPAARAITPVEQFETELLNKYAELLDLYLEERTMLCSKKTFSKKVKKRAKVLLVQQAFKVRVCPDSTSKKDKEVTALNRRLKALLNKNKYTHFYENYNNTIETLSSQEYFDGRESGPFNNLAAFKKALRNKQYDIATEECELKEMNIALRMLIKANR
jgi:hypothetical protein